MGFEYLPSRKITILRKLFFFIIIVLVSVYLWDSNRYDGMYSIDIRNIGDYPVELKYVRLDETIYINQTNQTMILDPTYGNHRRGAIQGRRVSGGYSIYPKIKKPPQEIEVMIVDPKFGDKIFIGLDFKDTKQIGHSCHYNVWYENGDFVPDEFTCQYQEAYEGGS